MNWREAKEQGYEIVGRAWEAGYVSRRASIDEQPIKIAGGKRAGQLYFLAPSWDSSRFCFRCYIARSEEKTSGTLILTITAKRKNARRHIVARGTLQELERLARNLNSRYTVEIFRGNWERVEGWNA